MCGIAGLYLKDQTLSPELGGMLSGMLAALSDRGPDSAGFAVYGDGDDGQIKLTLRAAPSFDVAALMAALGKLAGAPLAYQLHDTHAVVSVPLSSEAAIAAAIVGTDGIDIVARGKRMAVFKEVGLPADVAKRFGLGAMGGTHAVGHTRMATESAVTTNGAHPFTTGTDQCLVHNGSLSNHNDVRRELIRQGMTFRTENDSEVAAGYISSRMAAGASLQDAMTSSLSALDGFYTFVIGTETGFGVLRDPIACKPAVMAETDRWVAFGTEYRALVDLPGIDAAKVWEPEPARVYLWERH